MPGLFFIRQCQIIISNMSNSPSYIEISSSLQNAARQEIACYSLPYGGIGFTTHILTFYAAAMLFLGRRPMQPWKELKHKNFDIVLGSIQLVATIILTSITIARCRHEWQFVVFGIWMLVTSFTISSLTMALPRIFHKEILSERQLRVAEDSKESCLDDVLNTMTYSSVFLWALSCIAGVAAVAVIAGPIFGNDEEHGFAGGIRAVTIYIGCTTVFFALCMLSIWPLAIVFIFCMSLVWADWTLGVITGNLTGAPSNDVAPIYWTYFVVKRLSLLSS